MPTFIFSIPPSNNFIFGQQLINQIVLESNSLLIQGPTGNNGLTGATGPIGITGPPGDGGLPAVLSVDPNSGTYSIVMGTNSKIETPSTLSYLQLGDILTRLFVNNNLSLITNGGNIVQSTNGGNNTTTTSGGDIIQFTNGGDYTLNLSGGQALLNGIVNVNGFNIIGLTAGINPLDAVNVEQLDALITTIGLPGVLAVDNNTSTYSIIVNNNVNASAMASITNDYAIGAGNDPNLYGSGGASIKSLIHFTPDGSAMTLITQDVNVNSETIQMNPGSGTEIVSIDANSNFSETLTAPTGIDLQTLKFDGTLGSELKLKNNAQFTGFAFELSGFDNSSNGNRGSVYFDGVDGNTVLQYGLYDNSAITSVRPSLRSVAIGSTNPSLGFHGAVYDADYSAHYSLRSLITLQDLLTFSASQIAPTLFNVLKTSNLTGTYSIVVDNDPSATALVSTTNDFYIGYGNDENLGISTIYSSINFGSGGLDIRAFDGTNVFCDIDLDLAHGLTFEINNTGQSIGVALAPNGQFLVTSNFTTFAGIQYDSGTETLIGTNQVGTSILDRNLNDLRYLQIASYSNPNLSQVLTTGNSAGSHQINMNLNKIINLATGSNTLDAVNVGQLNLATASLITLNSLSGTTPIVYNNTTGNFSILQSGNTQSGYLSTTDWNTFNNKPVFASFSAVSPIIYNVSGQYSILQSTSTQSGYLSSTDWNTFNNKVSSLKEKANTILAASFSSNGTSLIYPVTFSTPYSNSNYSISIQGQDERTFTYTSKATTGFTIDSNSITALSGNVDFITMAYGEN